MTAEPLTSKVPIAIRAMGVLLGALAGSVFWLLRTTGEHWANAYAAAALAMFVLAPLFLANLLASIQHFNQREFGQVLGWLWLPLIVVLMLVLAIDEWSRHVRLAHEAEHPSIDEVHVNLSGRSIWFDPAGHSGESRGRVSMAGDSPHEFVEVTRYFGNEDKMAIYDAARLVKSFQSMPVYVEVPPAGQSETLPVVWRVDDFPDVTSFLPPRSLREGGEASLIKYWFFHYPERVEVVPVMSLSGSQEMDLWGSAAPVVAFHISNLTDERLARVEVDGSTLGLGVNAVEPEQVDANACSFRNRAAYAVNSLQGSLKVRWQFAQTNPAWHETIVEVPPLRKRTDMPLGRARLTRIDLYFQTDDTVIAERSLESDLIQVRGLSLQVSGPRRPLVKEPPCGFVSDRFTDEVRVFRD